MYDIYICVCTLDVRTRSLKFSTRTTMIPPLEGNSPQIKLANEIFRGLNESNMDIVGSVLHKDFSNVILPKSLGVPARDKEAYFKHYTELSTGYGVCNSA